MRKSLIFFVSCTFTALVSAETYHGSFELDGRGGGNKIRITFIYKLDLSNKLNITGDVSVTGGQRNCNRDYKLASGSIKGDSVILTSEPLEDHCGPFIFKGKLEGKEMIGVIPYRGQPREITLRSD